MPVSKRHKQTKVRDAALRLLKFRARSIHELTQRLQAKGYTVKEVKETILYLKKVKFLDDELFVRLWIQSRLRRSFGLRRIRRELKVKGVEEAIINRGIAQIPGKVSDRETVRRLVISRLSRMKGLDSRKIRARLASQILYRGFSSEVAFEVLDELVQVRS